MTDSWGERRIGTNSVLIDATAIEKYVSYEVRLCHLSGDFHGGLGWDLACSRHSDSGERCEVKRSSHRSPLSECLEQATNYLEEIAWPRGHTKFLMSC